MFLQALHAKAADNTVPTAIWTAHGLRPLRVSALLMGANPSILHSRAPDALRAVPTHVSAR